MGAGGLRPPPPWPAPRRPPGHRAATARPSGAPARPSSPRSPYGLASPLDGEETALVRPYLVAFEERRRRRERRLVLVHAADFGIDLIDLDQYVTGAREVA
ncbi:hypothetical protein [Streptomyces muensis]|uniref:Uncharacterized protein n=1 Tax=Streptomyces muensis TaxID=1077944 RepID=A0A9X1Q893_STRM4|nr:hypothetical protein [Streptomyces muensis]MCF1599720.1 hypothetical protein [Streptomyces muensis]